MFSTSKSTNLSHFNVSFFSLSLFLDYGVLKSLPDPSNMTHSYSVTSIAHQQPNGYSGRSHRTLSPSIKQLSESLNNLHLNHRNNNVNNGYSSNILNNNHLSSSTTYSNVLNNNSLSHATSMTALNHRSTSDKSDGLTLPTITSKQSTAHVHTSPAVAFKSTTVPPLSSVAPTPSIVTSSTTSTTTTISSQHPHHPQPAPSKITSVVRPVINDTNRTTLSAQSVMPQVTFGTSNYCSTTAACRHETPGSKSVNPISPTNHSDVSSAASTATTASAFIIPETRDQPAGLDFNDFLPKHIQQYGYDQQPLMSEMEAIVSVIKGHKAAKAGLDYRRKQVQIVLAMWATKDSKTALEYAVNLDEKSVLIDILNVMILKQLVTPTLFSQT